MDSLNFRFVKQMVDSALAFIGNKIDKATDKVAASANKNISSDIKEALKESSNTQTQVLAKALSRIESATSKLSKPEFKGTVSLDASQLRKELKGVADDIRKAVMHYGADMPDLTNVEDSLKLISTILKDQSSTDTDAELIKRFASLEKAIRDIKMPATFKLDDMQLRALSVGGSVKVIGASGGGNKGGATKVTVTNVALTSTGTEYTHTFSSNTIAWSMKLRDQGTLLYYAFVTGKLPNSGDGLSYVTVPQNFVHSQDGVEWSGRVIYLGAEAASQTAEIIEYRL